MEKQIEKLKEIITVVCNKIVQDKVFKESIAVQLDKIDEISEEKISETIEDEMGNEEESTRPKMNKKQVTLDSTINMNQRKNIDSVSKKLRIRKNPTTQHRDLSGDISKGVNWVIQISNKPKRLK